MKKPSETVQAAFGLFDDDSSDDEQQQLVVVGTLDSLSILPPPAPASNAADDDQEEDVPSLFAPWDDVKPLSVGPIELVTDCKGIGGQRGYIAARDLEPGTRVLVEQVYVPWPSDVEQSDPSFFIATLESILSRVDYKDIMTHLSYLHPQQLNELPDELLVAGQAKYGDLLKQLRLDFQHLELSEDKLLQNVFAMQCNAFDSGVFLYNAMFNHDCNPNCVKFMPESTTTGVPGATGISEVRVAKKILKGEALTISYLYPREQSRENRQQNLREQFGFVCICELCRRGDSVLPNPPPPSSEEERGALVEMKDLEKVLGVAEELLKNKANAAQVLQIALESLSDALEIVAHDHIVFIRIHKLVADSCDLLLQAKPNQDIREYAILFLRSSYELLELQQSYLDESHMDLARTLNDVSQGIQLLLSYDPNALLAEFAEWKDFREASFVENKYRQEYRRIKRLYE